ncbi:MAG: apolipoprotein N-acyltransferase, partial [Cyanobacteria bacterium J06649_11]
NGLLAEALNIRFFYRVNQERYNVDGLEYSWRNSFGGLIVIAIAVFISLHLIGFSLYSRPLSQPVETALKVGIVQGNIPNRIKFKPQGRKRIMQNYTEGYLDLVDRGVEAVLTPEGALPYFEDEIIRTRWISEVREKGVLAWIGGYKRQGNGRYTNSLLTFTGEGKVYSHYDKEKLVPLGEYIPFESILCGIINILSQVNAKQKPGKTKQIVKTPFGNVTVGICYGSAFAEQFRNQTEKGGEFILTASNNDPYSEAMQFQHHAQDIMRAIENDRWAVRATNTGYSAFVNPHGQTLWISGHDSYETHAETIFRRQTQTLYVRWGDWLCWVLLVLGFGFWVWKIGN